MTLIDLTRVERWARPAYAGRDRRESERVILYWGRKLAELGPDATVGALDLAQIDSEEWAHRFLIAVDHVIERSSLLLYGSRFAQLLQLPSIPRPDRPILRQLPPRYAEVFLGGCADARAQMAPMRVAGEIAGRDGLIEQYRAAFIPVTVKPRALTSLAFGAFNSRVVAPALAA